MHPLEIYKKRKTEFEHSYNQWQKRFEWLSWLRVLVFLGIILFSIFLYKSGVDINLVFLLAFSGLLFFLFLLKKHNHVSYQRNHTCFLAQLNSDEEARLEGKYYPTQTGSAYFDPTHPYAIDLDIFGRSSLFVLLNRATTGGGQAILAQWLLQRASIDEIAERQKAVAELSKNLEWQQQYQATGMHVKGEVPDVKQLLNWLQEPPHISNKRGLVALVYTMPVLTLTAILLAIFTEVTYHLPVLFIFINYIILGLTFKEVKSAIEKTSSGASVLNIYADLLRIIENNTFTSSAFQKLRQKTQTDHKRASAQIKRLANLLYNLEARNNAFFYAIVSSTVLWDLFFLIRIERWKKTVSADIGNWLAAVSEAEALNSLAGFYHANPSYIMPVLSTENLAYRATALGHPLILAQKRVTNSISVAGRGKTWVITGSNMSGKSTFLRTVGVNAVLAMMGAPVCAHQMEISSFQIFSAMRTQDSLEESVSSFYAELKRLKQLIELLPTGEPIFYLLDEILKGTNSQDRHLGAQALIRQFHKHNATGLISTHDLALGEMAQEIPGFVFNYSFNSEVINDKLVFDYKLQEGVCRSFNASKLMQQIGIEMGE